jgi:hypothetical protein
MATRDYTRLWRIKNPSYDKTWYEKNKTKYLASQKAAKEKIRKEFLDAYGNKCSCCSEDNQKFLTLEHRNNDGGKDRGTRRHNQEVLRRLKKLGWPKEGYGILCFNCNCGKQVNHGICPHKDQK